jgi:hypothetical protein
LYGSSSQRKKTEVAEELSPNLQYHDIRVNKDLRDGNSTSSRATVGAQVVLEFCQKWGESRGSLLLHNHFHRDVCLPTWSEHARAVTRYKLVTVCTWCTRLKTGW